jgi:toxin-antitoxin system PIN domain toxin
VILDANILIYARHAGAPQHEAARSWLEEVLNGDTRVGMPWQTLTAFTRIATNATLFTHPLPAAEAWSQVEEWLAAPVAWIPTPSDRYANVLGRLIRRHEVTGPLVSDAALAAIAIDHGVPVVSTDTDFARFDEVVWIDPLRK